ncbi:hypothetical protein [Neorhizobium galegae]|uniref:hypothetical protein n=1 Tax=Neorhizobium galegae TaxID=399 RepID=UPI000621D7F5|nr:hypothetical protein [Neorhizobium galegae]CDZ54018.1 Hypothetical protein NGAL_HAMBI2427_54420 [Neorhizobium galegae bv. orientalis]
MTDSLLDLINRYRTADTKFRTDVTLNPKNDHDDLWNRKEAAETDVIEHPCLTLDDVRRKVLFVLDDENVFDSVSNCTIAGEHALYSFLRSLVGIPATRTTAPFDESGQSSGFAPVDKSNSGDN